MVLWRLESDGPTTKMTTQKCSQYDGRVEDGYRIVTSYCGCCSYFAHQCGSTSSYCAALTTIDYGFQEHQNAISDADADRGRANLCAYFKKTA
jgi:hypothetical protein